MIFRRREKKAPSVRRNFAFSSAYQLLVALAPLITTPFLSRTIGAEGNGVFTYTQSIANWFVMAAVLGMSNYGVRTIAECGSDRVRRSQTFVDALAMQMVVGALVIIVYASYALTFGQEQLLLWALWGMWVLGSVLDISWLFFGNQEFSVPTIASFVARLVSITLLFVLVRGPNDIWAYVATNAGAFLAASLATWPFVRRHVDIARPTLTGALSHLIPNLRLFVPVVATSLYLILDKVMLGSMAGMRETGLYDYAEKVAKMPMGVITALGAVMLPKMTTVLARGDTEDAQSLVGTTMWFMEACAIALAFGIVGVAPEFVPVFFGEGYVDVVPLMRLLSAIVPLICATNVLGVQWLLPTKRDSAFTATVAAGATVNVIVNVFAIPLYGAVGASVATVAAELSVLVAQAWVVRGELPLSRYALRALPFAGIGLIMAGCIRLVALVLGASSQTLGGLILEVVVGGVVYLALSLAWCFATKNREFDTVFGKYLGRGGQGHDDRDQDSDAEPSSSDDRALPEIEAKTPTKHSADNPLRLMFSVKSRRHVYENAYCVLVSLWLVLAVLGDSKLDRSIPHHGVRMLITLIVVLLYFVLCWSPQASRMAAEVAVAFVALNALRMGSTVVCMTVALAYCARPVDLNKVVRCALLAITAASLLVIALSVAGVIPDILYTRLEGDGTTSPRHCLGFVYTTFCSHYILSASLMLAWLRGFRLKPLDSLLLFAANGAVYYFTDSRNSFILVLIVLVVCAAKTLWPRLSLGDRFLPLKAGSFLICAGIAFVVLLMIPLKSSLGQAVNSVLSGRLELSQRAFGTYGLTLFGQVIHWSTEVWIEGKGFLTGYYPPGRNTKFVEAPYNYVDSSYLGITLMLGVVSMMVIMVLLTRLAWWAAKNDRRGLWVCLGFLALHSVFDPQLLFLSYCPLLLSLGKPYGRHIRGEVAEAEVAEALPLDGDSHAVHTPRHFAQE